MATTQTLMLENIRMEYHSFRKDQVLTDKQLNDLIDYFEDQDRLTRTCLVGVGLVCGLKIKLVAGADPAIELSRGCGVTTDGDLLRVDATTFRHFRRYINKKKGTDDPIYDPFFPPNNNGSQMDLWELTIPNKEAVLPENSKELKVFTAETGKIIDDLAAILYLENYQQEPDKCTAIDCDNQGPHHIAAIRLLVLAKTDLDKIVNRDPVSEVIYDSIYKKWNAAATQYNDLPVLKVKRVILNNFNTTNPSSLKNSYTGILNSESGKLLMAIEKLYTAYSFLVDETTATNIVALKQQLQAVLLKNVKNHQVQYLYDFYKDIITAYNELREALFRAMYECCPDKYAFPKHIMLGEVKPVTAEPPLYRHDFYPSPAVSSHKETLARCRGLWQRLLKLIDNINIPDTSGTIKITPSSDYDQLLEKRAIPFYYKSIASLVKSWNYAATRQNAEKNILSYHAGEYANGIDSTINPLDYTIDANNFFRIEGHLGKSLNQALTDIDKVKNSKSLPFDLLALRMDKNGNIADIDPDDFDCQFDDLNTMLQAWLIEQQCIYASVTSFFSGFNNRRELGFHANITKYKATEKPVAATETDTPVFTGRKYASAAMYMENTAATEKTTAKGGTVSFIKGLYTQDKTVSKNLEVSKDAIGNEFEKLVKRPGLTKNDLAVEVERVRGADPALADLTEQEREVVLSTPIRMVAEVNELAKFNPTRLADLSAASVDAFSKRSELFCKYVKLLHDRMGQVFRSNTYKSNGFESYYLFILQEIIAGCCAGKQLEVILKEIEKRKQKILDSLSFTNYSIQHPGMEHKAGVNRGGTFILLYVQESKRTKILKKVELVDENERAVLAKVLGKDESKRAEAAYDDIESLALYIFKHQGEVDINEEFEKYKDANGIKDGSPREIKDLNSLRKYLQKLSVDFKEEESIQLSNNMVIADFCLPYLCCSECPPIAFIVPKQEYNLSLPKATACSDDEVLEFRREPFDGKITADGFDDAIIINGSKIFFDPSKVKAADMGKTIEFKIEGQVTDCRVTVFKHPVAKFEARVIKDDAEILSVEFVNLSDDATGKLYTYEWNLGDNSPAVRVTNKDVIPKTYKKAFLESIGLIGNLPVKLLAINGPCSDKFELSVPYTREERVSLKLPASITCNDADRLLFEVQPTNGTVASVNNIPGVVKDGNQFFFDPKQATVFATAIAFTVNNKPSDCVITVFKHPVPKFRTETSILPAAATIINVTFINETEVPANSGDNFIWEFSTGERVVRQDKAPFTHKFDITVIRNTGNELSAVLRVKNPACEAVSDKKVIPLPAAPQTTCADTVKEMIREEINFFGGSKFLDLLNRLGSTRVGGGRPGILLPTLRNIPLNNLVSKYADLLKDAETKADKFTNEAVRFTTLQTLSTLYQQELITNNFSAEINKEIIMLLVRSAWKLGLNVIRCQPDIDGRSKELISSLIRISVREAAVLKGRMPELNQGDNLIAFIKVFQRSPIVTNEADIRSLIKDFGTIVSQNFQP